MNDGILQYYSDTLLIEKWANVDAALDMRKSAGVLDSIVSGAKGFIENFVVDRLDKSSPLAFGESVLKLLAPSILFRLWPPLGLLETAGQMLFGMSVVDIIKSIVSALAPKISSSEIITPEEVNQAGVQAAGGDLLVSASTDLLYPLRELERNDSIVKAAQAGSRSYRGFLGGRSPAGGAFLRPQKGTPALYRMLGFLGPRKGKTLIVGFIVWLIKTVLASAGLLAGGSIISGLFGKDKEKETEQEVVVEKSEKEPRPWAAPYQQDGRKVWNVSETTPASYQRPVRLPSGSSHNLKPSGAGEKFNKNDSATIWIVPLKGGVENTVLSWATTVYPELQGHENAIRRSPSFNRTVNILEGHTDPRSPNYLSMPSGVNKIRDVVDSFAGDVASKIPKG